LQLPTLHGHFAPYNLREGSYLTAIIHPRGDESGFGHTFPALYNVVYCSRATAEVDEAAVQRIIATARRWNPEHGVTGILVFGSGIFFQWLEGPRDNVTALMSRLRTDRRHDSIVLLSEVEDVRERLFPDWDMELVTSDHIREVLQDALDSATDAQNAQALGVLLAELDAGRLRDLDTA
jgi:hypothetical protein